jgi:hypothetical protein
MVTSAPGGKSAGLCYRVHPEKERVAAMNEKVSNQTIQSDPLSPFLDYHSLSLVDLLEARNLYHLHLTAKQGVIGAVGRYFIRNGDSEPGARVVVKGTGPKTFSTAGIRSYSWPCIVVFVEEWIDRLHFRHDKVDPNN